MTAPAPHPGSILVVDDDAALAATVEDLLQKDGYPVEVALSAVDAITIVERNPSIAVALVDLVMPIMDGVRLMEELHRRNRQIAVVIMTGFGSVQTVVDAIKRGAEDYITKPFGHQTVRNKMARLMEIFELRERVAQLEANLERYPSFESFIGVSPVMQRVIERARMAAGTDASILILGETGTGKEMLARAIHAASPRSSRAFIPVNCGAVPHELAESELFGFRRGAFTGAYTDAPGIFAAADGGTVFLDEIGEIPKDLQVKLLRFLQEGELRPLGSPRSVQVDLRVIAATNRSQVDLRSRLLREDFYFRVATVTIEIPPLRTRSEDVLVMAQHFAARLSRRYNRELTLGRSALELLLRYSFPGNVRELENLVESAAAVSSDNPQTITDQDLKPLLQESEVAPVPPSRLNESLSIEQAERFAIQRALRLCNGNRTKTASLLGISRDTLYRKMRRFSEPV